MEKRCEKKDGIFLEAEELKETLRKKLCLGKLIGDSRAMKELRKSIEKISSCAVSVLILGESGTGKELVARGIHYLSSRAGKPFVPINCSAIPDELFENEFFGHTRGAFTGASHRQTGLVEEAAGGTLFLDEIGSISPIVQVKFLRLLQDKEYKPLGESRCYKSDVRILAATNKDLRQLIKDGSFREDLFYRLNVVSVAIPPLRDRSEDIPLLAEHFANKYSKEYNKPTCTVSAGAIKAFASHDWPGNVRELENIIQQLVVLSDSSTLSVKGTNIAPAEPAWKTPELERFNLAKKKAIYSFGRTYLTRLLTEYDGDVKRAATKAGKSRTALWNLLKQFDITPKQFRA